MRRLLLAGGWLFAAAIVVLSLMPAPPDIDVPHGDKLGHLLAYGLLMFWFCFLYRYRYTRLAYGIGWIALAVVIFGGWHPLRGMLGALLYGITKAVASFLQQTFPEVPVVLLNSFQWLLMLSVLLLVGSKELKRLIDIAPAPLRGPLSRALRVAPPQGLGKVFVEE